MLTHNRLFWDETVNPVIEFRRDVDRALRGWLNSEQTRNPPQFSPPCDIEEYDDHYLVTVEVAGVKKEDLKMEVIENQICVTGERRADSRKRNEGQIHSERQFGKFQRIFTLPAGINSSTVEANYQDGLLQIIVPKSESTKPRQIKIGSGNSPSSFFGRILNQTKEKEVHHPPDLERAAS